MVTPARREEVLGEYGPAMRALPNHRWRAFVEFYMLENPGRGAQTNAARRAGFGNARTSPLNMAHIAWRLMRDERMQARPPSPRRRASSCAAAHRRRPRR